MENTSTVRNSGELGIDPNKVFIIHEHGKGSRRIRGDRSEGQINLGFEVDV